MKLPYLDFETPDLAAGIRETLAAPLGGCIVRHMPFSADDSALEALSLALGTPLNEPHNLRGGMVCRVEVERKEQRPYANTPWLFPAHTDCTDYARPADTVLLLCEQPARSGGESFVSALAEFLPQLAAADLFELQKPLFFFRFGYLPILSLIEGQIAIRYNRLMLEMFQPQDQDPELTQTLAQLYDRLDQAIEAARFGFSLDQGDCLILNNRTTVHGRTAFDDDEQRLLKRVRLDLSR